MNTGKLRSRIARIGLGLSLLIMIITIVTAQEAQAEKVGQLKVKGTVKINGQPAASGDIVASGSTVETGAKSSAVVSLGKLGRVEVQESSTAKLEYDLTSVGVETGAHSSSVVSLGKLGRVEAHESTNVKITAQPQTQTAMLSAGRVRVSSSSGVTSKVVTSDGEVISLGSTEYIVDVTCGNTFVAVKRGTVELRAGSTVKQIAAGGQDTAGTARPGCTVRP
jgi:ribosomal 50S subunit-recycling heat shock protein